MTAGQKRGQSGFCIHADNPSVNSRSMRTRRRHSCDGRCRRQRRTEWKSPAVQPQSRQAIVWAEGGRSVPGIETFVADSPNQSATLGLARATRTLSANRLFLGHQPRSAVQYSSRSVVLLPDEVTTDNYYAPVPGCDVSFPCLCTLGGLLFHFVPPRWACVDGPPPAGLVEAC